jgi:hypothetical protein
MKRRSELIQGIIENELKSFALLTIEGYKNPAVNFSRKNVTGGEGSVCGAAFAGTDLVGTWQRGGVLPVVSAS